MIPIVKPLIGKEEIAAVTAVLNSGKLAQGEKVKEFEEVFAKYIGVKHCCLTSSGTSALCIALRCAGVGPGDEVITTPFSFIATANAILYCGAKPVFVDIDPITFNINPELIEKTITKKTRAVLPVDLYGQPCWYDEIEDICGRHNLLLVTDDCQAHGASLGGKRCGSFGNAGVFSFYPTKNMAMPEGGCITTNDSLLYYDACKYRNHGSEKKYVHDMLGFNYRSSDISAAIGLCQLKKLYKWNCMREQNAGVLRRGIKNLSIKTPPAPSQFVRHVYHQFVIRSQNRDALMEKLSNYGIGTAVHYPIPIHKQIHYQRLGYKCKLPEAELAAKEVLSLPVHPALTKDELKKIIEVCNTN